jgi:hypothetical protein
MRWVEAKRDAFRYSAVSRPRVARPFANQIDLAIPTTKIARSAPPRAHFPSPLAQSAPSSRRCWLAGKHNARTPQAERLVPRASRSLGSARSFRCEPGNVIQRISLNGNSMILLLMPAGTMRPSDCVCCGQAIFAPFSRPVSGGVGGHGAFRTWTPLRIISKRNVAVGLAPLPKANAEKGDRSPLVMIIRRIRSQLAGGPHDVMRVRRGFAASDRCGPESEDRVGGGAGAG